MAGYSKTDKFLHRLYLSNYSLAKATLEIEEVIHGSKAKKLEVSQKVFVTGLARSGTTAVMRHIHDTGKYASLQYSNMPFLLAPNIWKRKADIEAHERAHGDNIVVDGNSPEEFDEFFWKAFLNDSYITADGLLAHEVDQELLGKYEKYIKLIALSKEKQRYLSKNNNSILRLDAIASLAQSAVLMLFREPISHASSLKKLHEKFSASQKEDDFALEYFNYLGHHEFGLNHKPFILKGEKLSSQKDYTPDTLNYWLAVWLNYYRYAIEKQDQILAFICFEDLIQSPAVVYKHLWKVLHIQEPVEIEGNHRPSVYNKIGCDPELVEKCNRVYAQLRALTRYNQQNKPGS